MSDLIRFWFDEEVAAQAAAWLLRHYGQPMEADKLLSLLYLADRQAFLDHGTPMTGDTFIATADGPTLQYLECLVRSQSCPDETYGEKWRRYVRPIDDHCVGVTELDYCDISDYYRKLLASLLQQHGVASCEELSVHRRSLPEWRKHDGGSELIDATIILRDAGFTEAEIEEDRDNAAASMWLLTTLRR